MRIHIERANYKGDADIILDYSDYISSGEITSRENTSYTLLSHDSSLKVRREITSKISTSSILNNMYNQLNFYFSSFTWTFYLKYIKQVRH